MHLVSLFDFIGFYKYLGIVSYTSGHPHASISYLQALWCIHGWRWVNNVAVADRFYQKLRNLLAEFCIDILV